MNTQPAIVPRPPGEEGKPVRSLLEDIHQRSQFAREPLGVVNPKVVDQIAFGASVVAVIIYAVILLAMVWVSVNPTLGLKIIGSVSILLFALLAFRSINRSFAE